MSYVTCLHCYTILILNKLIEMLTVKSVVIFFFFWNGVQYIILFKSFTCNYQLFALMQGARRLCIVNIHVTCNTIFTSTREK